MATNFCRSYRLLSRRLILSLMMLVAVPCLARTSHAQDATPEAIYKQAVQSTMTLTVRTKSKESRIGTAFMGVKDNLAVTAWHVVRDAEQVMAKFSDGEEFDVSGLVDKDEKRDVAIIRVKVFGRPPMPFATQTPAVGAKAYVIGAPKGLEFSLSDGLVSQVRQLEGYKNIQFTCAASPGNSGGPLVNAKGEAMGVVSWQTKDGQNLNFAIPIAYVMALDSSLPTQPWDAVRVTESSPTTATSVGSNNSTKVDADTFDKALALVMMDASDMSLMAIQLETVIRRRFGFEQGLPVSYYSMSASAAKHLRQLSEMIAPDKSREQQRRFYAEVLSNNLESVSLMEKSIKNAQTNRGYQGEGNELYKQAIAAFARKVDELSKEDIEQLMKSAAIAAALPPDERVRFGFVTPSTKIILGVQSFTSAPLTLLNVAKGELGDKLGLKNYDIIQMASDKPVSTIESFKQFLAANVGQKVKITVLRDGKAKIIESKVPADLPK